MTAPEVTEWYRVTWWSRSTSGAPQLQGERFQSATDARVRYQLVSTSAEPGLSREVWDSETNRWTYTDLVHEAVDRERAMDVNRRGIATVRAVLAHRGRRRRPTSLDEALRYEGSLLEKGPPLVTADSASCVVCDYLCEHLLAADHPLGQLPGETEAVQLL